MRLRYLKRPVADDTQDPERKVERRTGEQIAVEAVEDPAVRTDRAPRVLDARVAFERRLDEISGLRRKDGRMVDMGWVRWDP